ncbi:hypothetical protein CEXT_678781 [Caerostris extrusa]|uniref:Uncharacterized protein n=1 Tax=Caerostris extrusa TaxID=172846 RepID=A0AAV4RYH0_CAEEX|nr:hypothetical protein CEXT_678781 [Caerostris extrusa]
MGNYINYNIYRSITFLQYLSQSTICNIYRYISITRDENPSTRHPLKPQNVHPWGHPERYPVLSQSCGTAHVPHVGPLPSIQKSFGFHQTIKQWTRHLVLYT